MSDKALRIFAIVVSVLFGATIIVWPLVLVGMFKFYQQPGSSDNPYVWGMAMTVWFYPIVCLGSIGLLVWALAKEAPGWKALVSSFIPVISYILFFAFHLAA